MAETKQIRLCGFGGQGIILGGKILGNASISAGKWVAGLSTYGGAARGGVCVCLPCRSFTRKQVCG